MTDKQLSHMYEVNARQAQELKKLMQEQMSGSNRQPKQECLPGFDQKPKSQLSLV